MGAPRSVLLALTASGLALSACVPESGPDWSLERAKLVFTSRASGAPRVVLLDWATGSVEPLLADSAPSWSPSVDPSGERFAYVSRRSGDCEIYVRAISDTGVGRNLSADPGYDVLPAWSPTGDRIAFMSTRGFTLGEGGPFPGHLYVSLVDAPSARRITKEPLTSSLGPGDFSPDGRYLLLSRSVEGQLDLFLVEIATGEERRITDSPENEYSGDFASDGRRVAYHSEDSSGSRIVVSAVDGTERRVLTPGSGRRYTPRWSPDDRWLLFTEEGPEAGSYRLGLVDVADGSLRSIPGLSGDAREGVWLVEPRR